ncbi:DUF943 family protein [Nissabacter archeti]|uniref:DUF943 family protein n=1 Tax=Nissabacter archeti TaxID=1917880 RepID=A0ABS5JI85_9GAMM|nr:DUF943 family protein [Nissabacter archeti]MBS0969571.1 DUF943 family protein [Nissabacter archeti]
MKKYKKIALSTLTISLLSFALWRLCQTPEIINIHQKNHLTSIVVKNFPITNNGKITWWLKNKKLLKIKYGIPIQNPKTGNYNITIWDIGDGYRVNTWTDQDSDLLCFKGMKTEANCIEKNILMRISRYSGPWFGGVVIDYTVGEDTYRQHGENGKIKRVKDEE